MRRLKHNFVPFGIVFLVAVANVVVILYGLLLFDDIHALEFSTDPIPIEFTLNSVLTVSTDGNIAISNLTPGNKSISSSDYTVTVSTNSVAGYTLSATVGCESGDGCFNSKILGDGNSNDFSMVESTTALTPGKWGVSLDSTATENSNFRTLPLYSGTADIINQTTDASGAAATGYQGTQSTTFRVGAYAADTQVAGTYTNVINFAAVANMVVVRTYIQDLTASECQTLASNADFVVYDKRDGKDYTVRYIEGACWMTQNLRITGTVSSEDSNFSTNSSVNVCEQDLTAGNTFFNTSCHDSGNTSNGVWYNFVAATAKTITGTFNSVTPTEDICPANWHLPSYDANNTPGSINSLASTSSTSLSKFSPVAGGNYHLGTIEATHYGFWWSTIVSNISSELRYRLYYLPDSLGTDNNGGRVGGFYIRCVRV